jgi:hypothetical protein
MRPSRSEIREEDVVKKSPSSNDLPAAEVEEPTSPGNISIGELRELAMSAKKLEEEEEAALRTSSPEPVSSPGTISIGELRSLALSAKTDDSSNGPKSPVIESNLTVGEARSLALSPRGEGKRSPRPGSPRKKSVRKKKKERGKLSSDVLSSQPAKVLFIFFLFFFFLIFLVFFFSDSGYESVIICGSSGGLGAGRRGGRQLGSSKCNE